jgi:hypothetical protein
MHTIRLGCFAAALAISTFAISAHADPDAASKETARAMMDRGHALRDAGDHAGALAQFRGADAIMHVPTTGLEMAREQAALGQLVEAVDTLERVARIATAPHEPVVFRLARSSAAALRQTLSASIPALTIHEAGIASGAAVDVTIDGTNVPAEALVAPIKVDPGHHVVVATSDGQVAKKEVDIQQGATLDVTLTFSPARPPATNVERNEPSSPPASTPSSSGAPWLRWTGLGLGGAGLVVGAVTGVLSFTATSAARNGCVNDRCPPSTWSDVDRSKSMGAVSTGAFIVAGVGAALFVTSFFVGSSAHPSEGSARLTVSVGVGSAGVGGAF